MIIVVDFDGTLMVHGEPNNALIDRINAAYNVGHTIKVVTARGERAGVPDSEKPERYAWIAGFLKEHGVKYNEISFRKEYAHLYIDDLTISPSDMFSQIQGEFTGSRLLKTPNRVIKETTSAEQQGIAYARLSAALSGLRWLRVPKWDVLNDGCIVTEYIYGEKPDVYDFARILDFFRQYPAGGYDFSTYVENIPKIKGMSNLVSQAVSEVSDLEHAGTLYHGDLSTTNVIRAYTGNLYLIDPNPREIFGSYLTDAGKAAFSFIAFEGKYPDAEKIIKLFGPAVLRFAVCEGLRVCKYRPEYITFVNNIADLC